MKVSRLCTIRFASDTSENDVAVEIEVTHVRDVHTCDRCCRNTSNRAGTMSGAGSSLFSVHNSCLASGCKLTLPADPYPSHQEPR